MCCIALIDDDARRPSDILIDQMWERNKDGAGLAWRETQEDGKVLVAWEKGLMGIEGLNRVKELAKVLPIPFIMHFRIATIGGIRANMTHPFPIDQRGQNTLTGKTDGYVLFHNGTWSEWDREGRETARSTGIPIPSGKWSDSRALAWVCSILGNGYMDFLPTQKGFALGPEGWEIYTGNGWSQVTDPVTREKIWCSNDHFIPTKPAGTGFYNISPYCSEPRCLRKDNLTNGKCPDHGTKPTKMIGPAAEVSPTPTPFFPATPKDSENPQGPLLSMGLVELAFKQGRVGRKFITSTEKAYERMKKGGKDGDRARRALILARMMPCFNGLQG